MLFSTKKMVAMVVFGCGLFFSSSGLAQTSDLLISEYVEGSSNNKYIEIFNGTSASVDLSNYQIRLYSNGNTSPNVTNTLSGFLANNAATVYSNSSASVYTGTTVDLGSMAFNGDDAIELYNTVTGLSVDIFGVIGCDPGTQWISTSNRTQNRTLRRNNNILSGVTTNPACTSSSGDFATLESEWTEFPTDNVANLGTHSVLSIILPVVDLGPDQSICNGSSITLFSGGDGTSFLWSTGETTENITVSAAGTYSVTVTNADGSTSDDVVVSFFPPTDLFITAPSTVCVGGSTEICATIGTTDLIISEYIEGSGLNKCIEIYNGTGSSVDLATEGYTIDITFNGGSSTTSIPLTGIIANGATHVMCDNSADSVFLNVADQLTNSNLWNGDDAIVLSKNGTTVDIFGVINNDPGAQWSGSGNSTQNATLRRSGSITSGITVNPTGTGSGAFTTLGTEWTLAPLDDASDLGSHTVTGDGTFAWSTGETTLCRTVSPSTTTDYTFSYTSVEGCVTDISTTVSISTLTASATATPIACAGRTAQVTVSATGGMPFSTGGYTGEGTFIETAGTYTYTVTDMNGCSDSVTITITEPTPVVASTSATPILCYGGTSVITISGSGGTAPYAGLNSYTVTPGTYVFIVADANGCRDRDTITVTQPDILDVFVTSTPILCFGDNADVTVNATGGTLPYTGTGTSSLAAGFYTFTVTDANGCTENNTITVNQPAQIIAQVSATPILCNGGTSIITLFGTGGPNVYNGGTFTELAGTYSYVVSDTNGCTSDSVTITITEPTPLVVSATATTIACAGDSATVIVSATGGTPMYTGEGTFNVVAGTHTFTVTDMNGCTESVTINVTEPFDLLCIPTYSEIDCAGGTTDVIISGIGGTAPYTGTGTFSSFAGTYTFIITDANGCTADTVITITEPAYMVASSSTTGIDCNGGTADIIVTVTGGTAPYSGTGTFSETAGTYTYTVTDANGCTASTTITLTEPTPLTAFASCPVIDCNGGTTDMGVTAFGGTAPYTGTGIFNVGAGTYTYLITDANGCTASVTHSVTEPDAIVVSIASSGIDCNGGTATLTVTGTGGTGALSGGGTFSVTAGTYTYTMTDANGCTGTATIIVTEPTPLTISATCPSAILCNGETADVIVVATGGTAPYTGTGTFAQSAGTVVYTVTDANGCTASTTITLTEPTPLTAFASCPVIDCNGGTTDMGVTAFGGTAPYTGTGIFNVGAGTYTYLITDANGCTASVTHSVTEPDAIVVSIASSGIDCNGGTATLTVTGTGGTGALSGGGTFSVTAGTYTYTMTDANGCTGTATIIVTEPTPLTISATCPSAILCNGETADVIVVATGGTAPYTGTGTFAQSAGTVVYTVTDANGCTSSITVTLAEPAPLVAFASCPVIDCNGGTTDMGVTAFGGTAPYTGTGIFNVGAGTYTYLITDANGCTASVTHSVTEPDAIVVSIASSGIDCNGGTATLTVSGTGGTGALSGGGTFSVGPGTYTYTMTDANGCTGTATITVTEPTPLTISATCPSAILCNGGTTDVIVVATGGTAPYTGTGTFAQGAGTVTYTVTDANGCTTSTTVTLTEPSAMTAFASCPVINCNGGTTNMGVTAFGGTAPYTGTGIFNVGAGTYTYVITDANGCTASVTHTVTEPAAIVATATVGTLNCPAGTADVTVTATGGTAPYTGLGVFTESTGTYTYTITDAKGCTATVTATVDECVCAPTPEYCASSGACSAYEWINQVCFGTINNVSGNNGGYGDFTNMSHFAQVGDVINLSLHPGFSGATYQENWTVRIDWNIDGDFNDPGEVYAGYGVGNMYGSITVPNNAVLGSTRVRISMRWGCYYAPGCGTYYYGEVEDYTLNIFSANALSANSNPVQTTETETTEGNALYSLSGNSDGRIPDNSEYYLGGKGLELGDIYPNPVLSSNGIVNLDVRSGDETNATVRILELSGKIMLTDVLHLDIGANKSQIDVTGFPNGSYVIEIVTGDNRTTTQLIVQ